MFEFQYKFENRIYELFMIESEKIICPLQRVPDHIEQSLFMGIRRQKL